MNKKFKYNPLEIKSLVIKRNTNFNLKIYKFIINNEGLVCLVGANGSGKTTLLEAIVGIIKIEKGNINILGSSVNSNSILSKTNIGYIPDDDEWLISELTAREYLRLNEAIYKEVGVKSDTTKIIKKIAKNLSFNAFDQAMGSLSHGNKKKIQIIVALMHDPKIIVVDELRNGLDPFSIKNAEDLLIERSKKGKIVLVATHDLWWAERLSHRVVMIKDGKIILDEHTKNIVKESGSLESKFLSLYSKYA